MILGKTILSLGLAFLLAMPSAWAQNRPDQPRSPQPPPQESPQPPQPAPPTQPTGPSQSEIDRARQIGAEEGRSSGQAAGRPIGLEEGRREGLREGERDGFNRCESEMKRREHDRGRHDGFIVGERDGDLDGRRRGLSEGEAKGQRDGQADGDGRANNDARNAATGPGRQRGQEQANQSDAGQVGQREGLQAGDRDARAEAERIDYPRGRNSVNQEKWSEPIAREDEFNQKTKVVLANALAQTWSAGDVSLFAMDSGRKDSVGFISAGSRRFPTTEEQAAYDRAYREAYDLAYNRAKREGYNESYREAFDRGTERGCQEARRRDYRYDYDQGYRLGRDEGYRRAYDLAYNRFYREAYESAFRSASRSAYDSAYDRYYSQHFESARASAYQERYREIYQAAFNAAHRQKFDQVYPGYAQAAYMRGRADETQDFADRPIRLTEAQATETIVNGLFEPDEALRVRFQVRNFAANRIEGAKIKVALVAENPASSTISEPQSPLVKSLEAESLTRVGEALEFRMFENQVGRTNRFRLEVYVNGRLSDKRSFEVGTQFMAPIGLVALPDLKEGLKTRVQVKVRNQANVASDSGLNIELLGQPGFFEVLNPRQALGVMSPGEERLVDFEVITRATGERVDLPLQLVTSTGAGRRVGLYSNTHRIPITNEYRIQVVSDASLLKSAGVQRVQYSIQNVGSRQLLKSLQLGLRISGESAANFSVLGPNPQFLSPLINGQAVSFVIPVMVKQSGHSGQLELEVKEEGRSVVIHRRAF